jgi:hypothetical protein
MQILQPPAREPGAFANAPSAHREALFYALTSAFDHIPLIRYQVILAGTNFFHIKEISTGRVRGFRRNHNEACALAKTLETSS